MSDMKAWLGIVSRASRIFPTCTHARMTSGRGNPHGSPLAIRACVHVGKIRLARETRLGILAEFLGSFYADHVRFDLSHPYIERLPTL